MRDVLNLDALQDPPTKMAGPQQDGDHVLEVFLTLPLPRLGDDDDPPASWAGPILCEDRILEPSASQT